ncbi:MAG: hypothetical protein NC483_04395 [Ruminococcus sp.]|nr:hypothetical protein [Ruminococcus sp.]
MKTKKLKYLSILFIIIIFVLATFGIVNLNKTSNIEISISNNEIHSQKDLKNAQNKIIRYFKINFRGCTIKKIWYDTKDKDLEQAKKENKYYEVIVLNINFDTDGKQKSLNSNDNYNYKFVLAKIKKYSFWNIIDVGTF